MEKVIAKRTLRGSYYNKPNIYEENIVLRRKNKNNVQETKVTFKEKIIFKMCLKSIVALAILSTVFLINVFDLKSIKNLSITNVLKQEFKNNSSREQIVAATKNIANISYNQIKDFIPDEIKNMFITLIDKTKTIFGKNSVIIYNEKKESLGASVDNVTYEVSSKQIQIEDDEIFYLKENNISFVKPTDGTLTSKYGEREVIFKDIDSFHYGIDIANVLGTKVVSSTDGIVTYVGKNKYNGNYVEVTIKDVVIKYCHLNEYIVKKGPKVSSGDKIGTMGNTGYSTGPHLHFEVVVKGKKIDPLKILKI